MTSKSEAQAAAEVLRQYCKEHRDCEGCEVELDLGYCWLSAALVNLEWKDEQ